MRHPPPWSLGRRSGGIVRALLVIVLALAFALVTAAPADAGFADRHRLHGGDQAADWPVVAMSGNTVHAFWTEWDGGNGNAVYYARSPDSGQTWTRAKRISPFSPWMRRPDVVVVGADIHLVFDSDHATPDIREVYYRRSRDGGATWESVRRLSKNDGKPSLTPSVGAEGSVVYVAWADIFFPGDPKPAATVTRYSDDAGTRFRGQRTAFLGFDVAPHIAVLDGEVHMVFDSFQDVWHQRSRNRGKTWIGPRRISPASLNPSGEMDIEAGNGKVHVVFGTSDWDAGAGVIRDRVFYRRLNHGPRWTWDRRVQMTGHGEAPMVNAGGGEVAVVWLRHTLVNDGVDQKIYLRTSGNGGMNWFSASRVASYRLGTCHTTHAGVATMGDAVVVWNKVGNCRSSPYAIRNV